MQSETSIAASTVSPGCDVSIVPSPVRSTSHCVVNRHSCWRRGWEEGLTGAMDWLNHRCHVLKTKGENYLLHCAKRQRRRTLIARTSFDRPPPIPRGSPSERHHFRPPAPPFSTAVKTHLEYDFDIQDSPYAATNASEDFAETLCSICGTAANCLSHTNKRAKWGFIQKVSLAIQAGMRRWRQPSTLINAQYPESVRSNPDFD
jgi:hypothetical protein